MNPESLYIVPAHVQTRWASPENFGAAKGGAHPGDDGRKRSACFPLLPGEAKVLLDVQGASGTVRRFWVTINDRSPEMLRGLRLEMFWDGASQPAVRARSRSRRRSTW